MAKQELEKSMGFWRWLAIFLLISFFILAVIFSFYTTPRLTKLGYTQGVNDTLNNYTCTPKIDEMSGFSPMLIADSEGNYGEPIVSLRCKDMLCEDPEMFYVEGIGICRKVNGYYECAK